MMSVSGYRVFAVLVILACVGANDPNIQRTIAAHSSTSFGRSGPFDGSLQAATYYGMPQARQQNGAAGSVHVNYNYSVEALSNLWTYAAYLQQYIAQLQQVVAQQIQAQQHNAAGLVQHRPSSNFPAGQPGGGGGVFGAAAGGFIGPGGGYAGSTLLPSPTNAQAGALPPGPQPGNGGPYHQGVFSSSSSSSSNINGHETSHHESTVGVDQNGQTTVFHSEN